MSTRTLKSIELFSGAGGLALGLSNAGFKHKKMVESNKDSVETLTANWCSKKSLHWCKNIVHADVRDVSFEEYNGKIDLVAGGPPCQPFSLGGKHKANQDSRDMFPQAVRAIKETLPKAFVFENVKGLLRKSFTTYFEYILLQLSFPQCSREIDEDWEAHLTILERIKTRSSYKGVSYNVVFRLINAADFGVPQKRERVFIVGFRSDLDAKWSFPDKTHSQDSLLWSKHVSGEYWDSAETPRPVLESMAIKNRLQAKYGAWGPAELPWVTLRQAISDLPDPVSNPIPEIDHVHRAGAKSYPGHTGSAIDEPSKTLKAGDHGVPGGENMIRFNDDSIRYLTPREASRLQTFPDEYKIEGVWSEYMRQIGNAVPVHLASVVGKSIFDGISEL